MGSKNFSSSFPNGLPDSSELFHKIVAVKALQLLKAYLSFPNSRLGAI